MFPFDDVIMASVTAVLFEISYYIGPHYNCTRMCMDILKVKRYPILTTETNTNSYSVSSFDYNLLLQIYTI